jgi:hypothetical protein
MGGGAVIVLNFIDYKFQQYRTCWYESYEKSTDKKVMPKHTKKEIWCLELMRFKEIAVIVKSWAHFRVKLAIK